MVDEVKEFNPYLEYIGDELHFEGVPLRKLAVKYGTPLYVYSKSYIRDRIASYKKSFPEALICYAVKANFNPEIIKIASKEGCGADVVSGGELFFAIKAGVDPQKIVYSGVGKTVKEIEYAIENNILMFNVESRMELDVINGIAKNKGKKVNVSIRVNPDVNPKTHPYIATGMKESKFGIDINKAPEEYIYAKSLNHLEVVGIHCHIGSQILDISPFSEAVEKVVNLYNHLIKEGIEIKYLDIGGGLGIKYKPDEVEPTPTDLKEAIKYSIGDIKAKLIIEPGRSLVGNGGILLTEVQFIKKKDSKSFVIVDAGMNDLIRPSIYNAYHHIVPVIKRNRNKIKADIVGPVCETGDFLALGREIEEPERGDLLTILSAGAYGYVMSSYYNLRERPAEILVEEGSYRCIKLKQGYSNLIGMYNEGY